MASGVCLFNAANNSSPAAVALLPPSATAQIPQARRLLEAIQAALHDAEMAFEHYNSTPAAAAGGSDRSLGPALFCCQAVMCLRRLSADLCAGMRCCVALDEGITAALQEVRDTYGRGSGMLQVTWQLSQPFTGAHVSRQTLLLLGILTA